MFSGIKGVVGGVNKSKRKRLQGRVILNTVRVKKVDCVLYRKSERLLYPKLKTDSVQTFVLRVTGEVLRNRPSESVQRKCMVS